MGRYLRAAAAARLEERGFAGESLITRSGGGAMTFAQAAERPVRDDHVRPRRRRGRDGRARARSSASRALITADVGGTSFDTCLITDGQRAGALRGAASSACRCRRRGSTCARSAPAAARSRTSTRRACCASARGARGPSPGPACYGRGGSEPTVTDAARRARHARRRRPRRRRRGSTRERRRGGARAARRPARRSTRSRTSRAACCTSPPPQWPTRSARSRSSRGATRARRRSSPFGGAGPLFGTLLADELDIDTHRRPAATPATSRPGACSAPTSRRRRRARASAAARTTSALPATDALARRAVRASSTTRARRDGPAASRCTLDMRYVGQEHTLTIAAPSDGGAHRGRRRRDLRDALRARVRAHVRPRDGRAVEIVSVRAPAHACRASSRRAAAHDGARRGAPASTPRPGRSPRRDGARSRSSTRDALGAGDALHGPAIVIEPTATTYLDAGFAAPGPRSSGALRDRPRTAERPVHEPSPTARHGASSRPRRRSDHDRGHPPRPQLGRRADEARAGAHRLLARSSTRCSTSPSRSTTARCACSRRRRACRSSWAR